MWVLERIVHATLWDLSKTVVKRLQFFDLCIGNRENGQWSVLVERMRNLDTIRSEGPLSIHTVGDRIRRVVSQALGVDRGP